MENYFSLTTEEIQQYSNFQEEPFYNLFSSPRSKQENIISNKNTDLDILFAQYSTTIEHTFAKENKIAFTFLPGVFFEMLLGYNVYSLLNERFDLYKGPKTAFISELKILIKKESGKHSCSKEVNDYTISQIEGWIQLAKKDFDLHFQKTINDKLFPEDTAINRLQLDSFFISNDYFQSWLKILRDAELLSNANKFIGKMSQNHNVAGLMNYTLLQNGFKMGVKLSHIAKAVSIFFNITYFKREYQPKNLDITYENTLEEFELKEIFRTLKNTY